MTGLDWAVIGAYLSSMIGLSVWAGRGQANDEDYYVGGRSLSWWSLGISTMATQSSANSFIGIPAFVALSAAGGLSWLQFELSVPLAMILIMIFLLPFFRTLQLVTVYEYLEKRFDSSTRYFLSAVFLISRGVGAAVGLYAASIIVSVCLGIPIWSAVLLLGVITLIYDTIGGMKGVVYSDVLQMVVLVVGLLLCIFYIASSVGGWTEILALFPEERSAAFHFEWGITDETGTPFWAYLIGGLFLYLSYYGVDQSQAQRALSSSSEDDTRRVMIFNGLARFPLTLLYLSLGVASYAAYSKIPEIRAAVPDGKPNYLVPQIILQMLPSGVRAILLASLLAAAMSSLDSSINSLSAVTIRDFVTRYRKLSPRQWLFASKVSTVVWGVLVTAMALFVDRDSPVVVTINRVGSAFYGPMLAAFVLGILTRVATGPGVILGVLAGVLFNLSLWVLDLPVHWMWWNFTGFLVTTLVALGGSVALGRNNLEQIEQFTLVGKLGHNQGKWAGSYLVLLMYFFVILGFGLYLNG